LYGKVKKSTTMIIPIKNIKKPRKIGVMDRKATLKINKNSKISEKEFLGI